MATKRLSDKVREPLPGATTVEHMGWRITSGLNIRGTWVAVVTRASYIRLRATGTTREQAVERVKAKLVQAGPAQPWWIDR